MQACFDVNWIKPWFNIKGCIINGWWLTSDVFAHIYHIYWSPSNTPHFQCTLCFLFSLVCILSLKTSQIKRAQVLLISFLITTLWSWESSQLSSNRYGMIVMIVGIKPSMQRISMKLTYHRKKGIVLKRIFSTQIRRKMCHNLY